VRNKIASFLQKHAKPGAHLGAAVSGGMDSMAMLDALIALTDSCDFSLTVVHFNHHLRGDESVQDEVFVREFCAERDIPLQVGRGDVAAYASEHGIGLEEAARSMRYAFFSSFPELDYILTAHTADDNLETVLMRLVRGAGLHGLAGIPPVRGKILRPMLEITREEILQYCEMHGVPYVKDSSNDSDAFFRNRIRHSVVPLLKRENPSLVSDTAEMCRLLSDEDRYMQDQARQLFTQLVPHGTLHCSALLAHPEAMRLRVMGMFLSDVPEIGKTHLFSALKLSEGDHPSASMDLPCGYRLRRVYDELELVPPAENITSPESASIQPGQTVSFGPWTITCSGPGKQPENAPNALSMDASVLKYPLAIRSRLPGDKIRLPGGTKKISRLLIDEKVPAYLRDYIPILCAGEEIAAVLPIKAAEKYRCQNGKDSIVLFIEKMEGET